jgi:glycosyltransferase involved in cell wall biosynthesis
LKTNDTKKLVIFIPALNEAATLPSLIETIRDLYPGVKIMVINDGSNDGTIPLLELMKVDTLNFTINQGVGCAIKVALIYAKENHYESAIQIDGDGQHAVESIELIKEALKSSNLVIGSRYAGTITYHQSSTRKFTITVLSRLMSYLLKQRISDPTSGFRGFDSKAIQVLAPIYPSQYLGDTLEALIMGKHNGLSIDEIPVTMHARQGGVASTGRIKSMVYLTRAMYAIAIAEIRSKNKSKDSMKKTDKIR